MSAAHTLKITPEVQAVLRESRIEADRVVLPGRQLDRKLYDGVIKVLGAYDARWDKRAKAIVFPAAARPKLMEALGSGVVQREKVIRQAFYTPPDVAATFVAFTAIGRFAQGLAGPITLLEPSAGEGALIDAALSLYKAKVTVTAVELDPGAAAVLTRKGIATVHCADFLGCRRESLGDGKGFDVLIMNPPYQRGQALKHVRHALGFLKPGGVLGAIVPVNFPDKVDGHAFETVELGAGAFAESGTKINTKMIRCVL